MEPEAAMSWQVAELKYQLESTCCESQDQVDEATGAWALELLVVEQATATKRGLDAAKVHLAKTEAVLHKSLEALEMERKARSEADQEVLMLWWHVLVAEESNARLLEKVSQ